MYIQTSKEEKSLLTSIMKWFLIAFFLLAFGRLFELQIIKGAYFRGISESNRVRRVPIRAPRGNIYARGGELIAGSKEASYQISFNKKTGFEKTPVLDSDATSSGDIFKESIRIYPEGANFAHLTGYVGEINGDELGKIEAECPEKGAQELGSVAGRAGLEEQYDCLLRGIDGEELVEVDAQGRKIRILGRKQPIKGSDLLTNIDINLQRKVAELMKDKKGSVIISDFNGEILSLYSSPSYNPNIFREGADADKIKEILNSADTPLLNRAIGGIYHPGSIFKPIVATAGLEESVIDKSYKFDDVGYISLATPYGDFKYNNWYYTQYGRSEGQINLVRALSRSTDTFFYNLGEMLGVDKIDKWSEKFGLTQKTNIDLPGEVQSLVPDPVWKMRVKGERWFTGNTYNISIGQGDLAVTPISIHTAISTIANNGKKCPPHILRDGGAFGCSDLKLKQENIDLVKEGMEGVCNSGGTGYTFFDFKSKNDNKYTIACKTGTAEVDDSSKNTHAWFTAFSETAVNSGQPQIMATILVERGGEGSKVAGPIARQIFDYWVGLQGRH